MRVFMMILSSMAICLFWGAAVAGANCMAGGCHPEIAGLRYMHGPVGAEFAGVKGCEACHQSVGRACNKKKGGAWKLKKLPLCGRCHAAGTSTVHSSSKKKCLSCHNPHGSNKSASLLR